MCLSLIYFIFIREPEKYKLLLRSGRVLCCWWAASVPAQQTLYYGSSTESFSNTTCCVSPLLTPSIPLGSVEIPMLAVKGVQSPASFTRFFASFLVKGSIRCNNLSFTIDRALWVYWCAQAHVRLIEALACCHLLLVCLIKWCCQCKMMTSLMGSWEWRLYRVATLVGLLHHRAQYRWKLNLSVFSMMQQTCLQCEMLLLILRYMNSCGLHWVIWGGNKTTWQ